MQYIISGKNIDVTEGLRSAVSDKIGKLERYFTPEIEEDDEIKIIRSKRFAMKPMDPEEACIQMELLGHNFYVFRNAATDEVNVVYKRKGNTFGLIEPEF